MEEGSKGVEGISVEEALKRLTARGVRTLALSPRTNKISKSVGLQRSGLQDYLHPTTLYQAMSIGSGLREGSS